MFTFEVKRKASSKMPSVLKQTNMNEIENKRFDELALSWDEDPKKINRARRLGNLLKELIRENNVRSAMDFGAGTGLVGFQLLSELEQLTFIELSQGMAEQMEKKKETLGTDKVQILQTDLTKENHTASYDLIYTLLTLHHIHDYEAILKKLYSNLNPGGWLCIADLEEEDGSFHAAYPEFDGHNGFDQKELEKLLEEIGFQEVNSELFITIEKEDRSYPMFFMRGKRGA